METKASLRICKQFSTVYSGKGTFTFAEVPLSFPVVSELVVQTSAASPASEDSPWELPCLDVALFKRAPPLASICLFVSDTEQILIALKHSRTMQQKA